MCTLLGLIGKPATPLCIGYSNLILSDCNWIRLQLATLAKWLRFEPSCNLLNFRFRACFEQGVLWHSGNYRVWIHSWNAYVTWQEHTVNWYCLGNRAHDVFKLAKTLKDRCRLILALQKVFALGMSCIIGIGFNMWPRSIMDFQRGVFHNNRDSPFVGNQEISDQHGLAHGLSFFGRIVFIQVII